MEYINSDNIKSTKLFRYIDKWKFDQMLGENYIYFNRLDLFGDKLEGIMPFQIFEILANYENRFPGTISNNNFSSEFKEQLQQRHENSFQHYKNELKQNQSTVYVSCWFAQNYESQGMWELYGNSEIAISIDRIELNELIKKSIAKNQYETTFAGLVEYQNYNDIFIHDNEEKWVEKNPFYRKHIGFKHEEEYRYAIYNSTGNQNGLKIECNIAKADSLTILLSPKLSHEEFEIQKKEILDSYPKLKIKKSELTVWNNLD